MQRIDTIIFSLISITISISNVCYICKHNISGSLPDPGGSPVVHREFLKLKKTFLKIINVTILNYVLSAYK